MSNHRTRRVDRRGAERLLAGEPAAGPLAALLRAAAAPAHPEELSGERAAMAAFEDVARLDPVPEPRRPSMLKSALAKILTVKAAALLAAAGASGVVLAATSGALPTPWTGSPADDRPAVSTAPHTPSGRPSDAGRPADAAHHPSPAMIGLCQAYTAQVGENPGKALDSPAFTALVTAAGGEDGVDEFCQTVADAAKDAGRSGDPHGRPSDLPTPTEPGGDNPGGEHGDNPGGDHADEPTHPAEPSARTHAPDSPTATGTPTAVPPSGGPTPPAPGS